MPLFEYSCQDCAHRFSVLIGMTSAGDTTVCPKCQSEHTSRRISRFSRILSADEKLDRIADEPIPGDDPRDMRRWVDSVSGTLGDDLGEDFREYIDAAEEEGSVDG